MEEPSGTGSRGASRDPPAPAPGSLSTGGDSRTFPTTHRRCLSRFSRCAIDGEARQPLTPSGWSSGRTRDDRTPRTAPRTIRSPVGAPLEVMGGSVTGFRDSFRAPRRRPVSRPIGPSLVRVADHVRAGMEVMSTAGRPLSRRRARPPEHNRCCAPDPGRSSSIDIRGSVPRLPRLPGSAHVRGTPNTEATEPCRRPKQRHRRRRSSTA